MKTAGKWLGCVLLAVLALVQAGAQMGQCRKLTVSGQIEAGRSWRQPIGQGWILRLVPIAGSYTGWDLTVDREPGLGYPDALLLATPPYNSINEREIGTTFGLRAQDAIGWNPRSFRFLTDLQAFHEAQRLLPVVVSGARTAEAQRSGQRLMELALKGASGQLRIEDARLTPGIADPPSYAQAWALRAARLRHTEAPASDGKPTPRGALDWMRFTVTLWLPDAWVVPAGVASSQAPCQ